MKKILVALDCTPHSRRALDYVAAIVPHIPGAEIVLFAVLLGVPRGGDEVAGAGCPPLEEHELHGDQDHLQERIQIDRLFEEAAALLEKNGLDRESLHFGCKAEQRGVAQDVLAEAAALGCDTVAVGRRGLSKIRELVDRSVSSDLIHRAKDLTIWVVA